MLAHIRGGKEYLRRASWTHLRLVLGVTSVRGPAASGVDLGPEPRRIPACVDRVCDLESARIDFVAPLVRVWVTLGCYGSGQSDDLCPAAIFARVGGGSAMAVRTAFGWARHEDSFPVYSD